MHWHAPVRRPVGAQLGSYGSLHCAAEAGAHVTSQYRKKRGKRRLIESDLNLWKIRAQASLVVKVQTRGLDQKEDLGFGGRFFAAFGVWPPTLAYYATSGWAL